ncbi:hypothetical protein B566_EDAN004969 [Ephemera danica]|nr:hypothetical protein B566_EDAN004969 [Ephemera danica]
MAPLIRAINDPYTQWYECDTRLLGSEALALWMPMSLDAETNQFLDLSCQKSDWIVTQMWHSLASAILSWFMTRTSINGNDLHIFGVCEGTKATTKQGRMAALHVQFKVQILEVLVNLDMDTVTEGVTAVARCVDGGGDYGMTEDMATLLV